MNNDVFEVVEKAVTINAFNKMIPEFRCLTTQEDLLYVYHMGSYRSPYSNYDTEERKIKVIKDFCPDIVLTPFHKAAIDKYIELQQTPTMRYLDANLIGMNKVRQFLLDVNLKDVDDKGKPIYKPYDVTNAIKEASKIIESIEALRQKVEKELAINGDRVRGDYKVNKWEQ